MSLAPHIQHLRTLSDIELIELLNRLRRLTVSLAQLSTGSGRRTLDAYEQQLVAVRDEIERRET